MTIEFHPSLFDYIQNIDTTEIYTFDNENLDYQQHISQIKDYPEDVVMYFQNLYDENYELYHTEIENILHFYMKNSYDIMLSTSTKNIIVHEAFRLYLKLGYFFVENYKNKSLYNVICNKVKDLVDKTPNYFNNDFIDLFCDKERYAFESQITDSPLTKSAF